MVKIAPTQTRDLFFIQKGAVSFQVTKDGLKELLDELVFILDLEVIKNEDLRKAIGDIHNALESKSSGYKMRSTTNNNDMRYTGSSISTDDLMQLNKELKKN